MMVLSLQGMRDAERQRSATECRQRYEALLAARHGHGANGNGLAASLVDIKRQLAVFVQRWPSLHAPVSYL